MRWNCILLTNSHLALLALVIFGIFNLSAQDIHFSQYYRTPLLLNPANTGGSDKDFRLAAIARNQWQTVSVGYNSVGLSGDVNFKFKHSPDRVGLGAVIVADQAGDSRFTTLQGSLSGAYHFVTSGNDFMILSIGGALNYFQRRYDPFALTYDEQFNGDYFDPSIPVTEQFDILNLSFIDAGIGVNYQQTLNSEHVFNLGLSAQHIRTSEQNFLKNSTNTLLSPKYNFYGNGEFHVYKKWSVVPLLFYQYQDRKDETVIGIGASFNFKPDSDEKSKVKAGISFRLGDAFIPWIHLDQEKTSIQLSYDMNTSPLRVASNSYGGLELSFGYLFNIRKDKDRHYDVCPYIWF
ncbi:MAG: PorP/SprF family type IX secretion system membrane protein [Chitinophagales bacterium]